MIAQPILDHFADASDARKRIIAHVEGPLLVIAGPGSGKTFSLVLRTLKHSPAKTPPRLLRRTRSLHSLSAFGGEERVEVVAFVPPLFILTNWRA